jgi:AmmeMemoRadiSam system protein B
MLPLMNRPAAVAGTWYPGSRGALTREVDEYLAGVEDVPRGRVHAVIAPHAGIMFSGPIAAYAYKAAAAAAPYDAAILLGPSHFAGFDGIALYPACRSWPRTLTGNAAPVSETPAA